MLAATHSKKFKKDFAGRRIRHGAGKRFSTAFQWSSKVVPHPAGGRVLVSLPSAQDRVSPAGCGFFLSRRRLCERSASAVFLSAAFFERSLGPLVSASDSAMAVTSFGQTCLSRHALVRRARHRLRGLVF